mmetsp:Transcript_9460/g.21336  ORF Transcript_9460/g.21336 Transcript_9460/m.21336 type:complete len:94 (+) Transcript_9460:123-404(+)
MAETPAVNEDIESSSVSRESTTVSNKQTPSAKVIIFALITISSIIWGSVMTALYVKETKKQTDNTALSPAIVSTELRSMALWELLLCHILMWW